VYTGVDKPTISPRSKRVTIVADDFISGLLLDWIDGFN
jgi:hypothetical protein